MYYKDTFSIHGTLRFTACVLNAIIARNDGRVKRKWNHMDNFEVNFPLPFLFVRTCFIITIPVFKKKPHKYTFSKEGKLFFYDNLTLNVGGIQIDQNKQQ